MIRLGTRGSLLARTQAGMVADRLRALGCEVELVTIRTEGDVNTRPLSQLGGIGVFAAQLRTALLAGEVDLAVHSFKDLPTAGVPGLAIAAVPERESPFDALVARDRLTLAELPPGARVGTGSPRRRAQLARLRPDIELVDIRGNVDTRLGFVLGGRLDAVVLAESGLSRLGRAEVITERLDALLPAPAQGALAIETRDDAPLARDDFARALGAIDDPVTHGCARAERAVLAALHAGCAAPVGTHAVADPKGYRLTGLVASVDGTASVQSEATGDDPEALGAEVASALLAQGAAQIADLSGNETRRT